MAGLLKFFYEFITESGNTFERGFRGQVKILLSIANNICYAANPPIFEIDNTLSISAKTNNILDKRGHPNGKKT